MTAPALPAPSRRDAEIRALLIPLVEECAWDEVLAIVTARRREISATRQTQLERLFLEFMEIPADERPDFYTFAHQRRVPTLGDAA